MEHHVTVDARRECWSSECQLYTTTVRDQELNSKIRARQSVRNRLVLQLTWTDERRRRMREQQVLRKKVLRVNRVTPVITKRHRPQHVAVPPRTLGGMRVSHAWDVGPTNRSGGIAGAADGRS